MKAKGRARYQKCLLEHWSWGIIRLAARKIPMTWNALLSWNYVARCSLTPWEFIIYVNSSSASHADSRRSYNSRFMHFQAKITWHPSELQWQISSLRFIAPQNLEFSGRTQMNFSFPQWNDLVDSRVSEWPIAEILAHLAVKHWAAWWKHLMFGAQYAPKIVGGIWA